MLKSLKLKRAARRYGMTVEAYVEATSAAARKRVEAREAREAHAAQYANAMANMR